MFSNKYFITKICGRQLLDSRGFPTVEAEVTLSGGATGTASVPSGASTGRFEAFEKRDNIKEFYFGRSVTEAVSSINCEICEALMWKDARNQAEIDSALCLLDGTENKQRLGANAILAVSIAVARAAANASKLPLYLYLGGKFANILPVPMMNILNGGAHASNNLDIQEFMIMPIGFESFSDAVRCGAEIYKALRDVLIEKGHSVCVGDEGGFAPNLENDAEAIEFIISAIEKAGYVAGENVFIALDIAASEWFCDGRYIMPKRKLEFSREKLGCYLEELFIKYPIISMEDPFSQEDFEAFSDFTKGLSGKQIVGDDLFVTNSKRLMHGIDVGACNSILIKPNQIGTITEVFNTVRLAYMNGYRCIVSHRSGETEDSFIADLAVALGCGQIKLGAPCRADRTAKYNRLLKIEEELSSPLFYGKNILS